MFISDQVAQERLRSSRNVLTVIDTNGASEVGIPHTQEPPPIVPEALEDVPVEDQTCGSAADIYPSGSTLRKMLGMPGPGRKQGTYNMSREEQAAIANCAQLVDTRTAAKVFGTSHHHADELKHGFTHEEARYGYKGEKQDPNKELEAVINRQKKDVRDLAFEKLTKTLGLIDDDKLRALTDPTKLGRLAKDLSGVVDKVLPKQDAVMGGVHFHVWRPEQRAEETYDTVVVGRS